MADDISDHLDLALEDASLVEDSGLDATHTLLANTSLIALRYFHELASELRKPIESLTRDDILAKAVAAQLKADLDRYGASQRERRRLERKKFRPDRGLVR